MHVCPLVTVLVPHVGGPILPPGCPTVIIGFMPAARVGDMAVCVAPVPDVIAMGSLGVVIGFMPAARMGDLTAHGGTIAIGCPTVIIGDTGGGAGGGAGGGSGGGGGGGLTPPAGAGPDLMTDFATQFILAGPVGNAFTEAAHSGAPLVCTGPCEACGHLMDPDVPKPPEVAPEVKPDELANKTYKTKPTLDDLLKDPFVDGELKRAWNESDPNGPEVKKGDPGSTKHEQGGGIYWNKKTGELKVERVPAGTRDGNSGAPPGSGDWEKVSEFHTHPNTAAEGYSADPSPADKNYVKNVSHVPEIIETHDGRKTIPYP